VRYKTSNKAMHGEQLFRFLILWLKRLPQNINYKAAA